GKRAIFLCNEASAKWSVCDRAMATRDQTRDGTAVTKRSEVAPKTRIVCGGISNKERAFEPFPPSNVTFSVLAANGPAPFSTD
ncbi:MAG: hypothetical protein IKD54_00545, partial [Clostridia bacterium]|nr:hypothetical protein [Clostridia bacterium]